MLYRLGAVAVQAGDTQSQADVPSVIPAQVQDVEFDIDLSDTSNLTAQLKTELSKGYAKRALFVGVLTALAGAAVRGVLDYAAKRRAASKVAASANPRGSGVEIRPRGYYRRVDRRSLIANETLTIIGQLEVPTDQVWTFIAEGTHRDGLRVRYFSREMRGVHGINAD